MKTKMLVALLTIGALLAGAAGVEAQQSSGTQNVQGLSASGTAKSGRPVQGGGVFNTTQPTVTTGQTVEAQYSARGAAIVTTGVDAFNVTVNAALPAGTNVIGHVIVDATSTTAVTQATAANLKAEVVGAGTAGAANANPVTVQGIAGMTKLLVTPDSVALPANQSVNISQINSQTPAMGAGNAGADTPRFVLATDQATIPVTQGALTSIVTGQQAVTGTVAVLPTQAAKQVCIKVLSAGTQVVYYGPTGTTTGSGGELSPGDGDCMPLDNVNRIFVIAGTTGSTIAWRAVN